MTKTENKTMQGLQEKKPYERYRVYGDIDDAGIGASIKTVIKEYFNHHPLIRAQLHNPIIKGNTFSVNIDFIPHSENSPVMRKLFEQIGDKFRNYPRGKYKINYEQLPCDSGEIFSEKDLSNGTAQDNNEVFRLRGKLRDLENTISEKQRELSEKNVKLEEVHFSMNELENHVAKTEKDARLTLPKFVSDVALNLLGSYQSLLIEVASDWEILSKQNDLELITDSVFLNMNHTPLVYFKRKYNVPCEDDKELQSWLSQFSFYSVWDAQPNVKNILNRKSQIEADMAAFTSIQETPVSPQLLESLKQQTRGHPKEIESLKTQLVNLEKQFSLGKLAYESIVNGKEEPDNFYEVVDRSRDRLARKELLPILFAKLSEVYIPSFDGDHAFEKYLHKAINNSLFSRNTELYIGNPVQYEGYTCLQIIPTGKPSQGTLNGLLMQYEKDMFSYLNRSSAKYLSNKVLESLGIIIKPVFVWS